MATRMTEAMKDLSATLRIYPTQKRIRALLDGETVVDSVQALVVWEPRRVTPSYAVPEGDIAARLQPATLQETAGEEEGRPLDPRTGFRRHTTDGAELDIVLPGGPDEAGRVLRGAAFSAADPDLRDAVILDAGAFDEWLEDDEPVRGHPRDPYHRIDVRLSRQHVMVSLEGRVLADTHRPHFLYETSLPQRTYIPREDVSWDLLTPTDTSTVCPYKGQARYWSAETKDGPKDVAWSYEDILPDSPHIKNLVCFYDERVDVAVDGVERPRPKTPWA
jgi:uncharacterized protein (DUF427 family)